MRNKLYVMFPLFVLMVLALGACNSKANAPTAPTSAPSSSGSSTTASTDSTTAPVSPSELSAVPREETVIFENIDGRVPAPNNMNPYINGLFLDWGMWQATQEALFYLNLETGELIPWQAESFSFNPDFTEVTIKIRDGVKWSDGIDFTADDIAFTINMLKGNEKLQYGPEMKQWVESVKAVDPKTAVITLTGPNPRFIVSYFSVEIWRTVLIAPKHIWEGQDPLTFTNFDLAKGWPVGTGPYQLVRSTESESVYDLRPTWWAAETGFHDMPIPKRAIWVGVPDENTRAAMAADSQLDALWILQPSSFEAARKKNPNLVAWTDSMPYAYLDACPRDLGLNTALKPLDDVDIRWAINYSLDRDQINAIAFQGATTVSKSLFPAYAPLQAFLDRNEAVFEQYPVLLHSPEKVEEIMTSKGYTKDNSGLWAAPDGSHVAFTMLGMSGETDQVKMGPIIVDQLRSAGFDVDFRLVERAVFSDEVSRGTVGAWLGGTCAGVTDPYLAFSFYHSRWVAPLGEVSPGPHATNSRWSDPEFDKLVEQMAVTAPDDPAFGPLADQALALWTRELPRIPLLQAYLLTPFSNTYWTNWPTSDNPYIHPGHWWVTGNQMLINIRPAK